MDRRQLVIRIVMLLMVAVAMFAGWRATQNAGPMAEMKAAREAREARTQTERAYGEAEAMRWVNAVPERQAGFAALAASLERAGVGDVVPVWALLRTNPQVLARCGGPAFMLPPREQWANIVPALRLVRDRVIPAVGAVEVASAQRDAALNQCSGGARGSRHLIFAAVDLVPLETRDARDAFTRLCAAWRAAGPQSGWGLGAYFDPTRPAQNSRARFHVDGTGWRTWGFSRSGESSGCHQLRAS